MEKKKRLAGRFLPSRVYARWVWTVRSCLVVLPAILFLAGALTLYLSSSRFKSIATFEYLGKRPLPDVVELLKSENLIVRVHEKLDLGHLLGFSRDSVTKIIRGGTKVRTIPATDMVEVEVILTRADLSRDVAVELVNALKDYEESLATMAIKVRIHEAERAVTEAEDRLAGSHRNLVRLISVRGEETRDPVSQLDIDAARAAWTHDNQRMLDARSEVDRLNRELVSPGHWVSVHTIPQISSTPVGPKTEDTLGIVTLRSFGIGLACALAIPYLLELAFPRRRRKSSTTPVWQKDETDLSSEPAHV